MSQILSGVASLEPDTVHAHHDVEPFRQAALRLIPVVPHSLANYALGLTKLPVGPYALGSLLGQLPLTVAYVDFGAAGGRLMAGQANWLGPIAVGILALGLSILLPRLWKH